MKQNHTGRWPISQYLKVLSPAIVIYGAFFIIRIMGIQPLTESGMGEFITASFFLFGASVSFFVYFLHCLGKVPAAVTPPAWWLISGYFLMFLAFDEIFMIHEWICYWLEIRDIYIFLLYGFVLLSLIYFMRRRLARLSLALFAAFIFFAGIAVVSDTLFGEGMITIFNRALDYEQIAESFGAFFLAAAFASVGVSDLSRHAGSVSPVILTAETRDLIPDRTPL